MTHIKSPAPVFYMRLLLGRIGIRLYCLCCTIAQIWQDVTIYTVVNEPVLIKSIPITYTNVMHHYWNQLKCRPDGWARWKDRTTKVSQWEVWLSESQWMVQSECECEWSRGETVVPCPLNSGHWLRRSHSRDDIQKLLADISVIISLRESSSIVVFGLRWA